MSRLVQVATGVGFALMTATAIKTIAILVHLRSASAAFIFASMPILDWLVHIAAIGLMLPWRTVAAAFLRDLVLLLKLLVLRGNLIVGVRI